MSSDAPARSSPTIWEPIRVAPGQESHSRSRRVLHPRPRRKPCRCRPTTRPRWCRSIRWSANSASTMRASSILASAMRERADAVPRRAGGALARGAVHPGARPDRRPPDLRADARAADRSTGRASARTIRRQGLKLSKHFRSLTQPGSAGTTVMPPLAGAAVARRRARRQGPIAPHNAACRCRPAVRGGRGRRRRRRSSLPRSAISV